MRASAAVRFAAQTERSDGCWRWKGTHIWNGYGRFGVGGAHVLVHRFAYEQAFGPIPEGMWVLHRCDVRDCVRPDHLFLGTVIDNVHDMMAKGRRVDGQRRKTECIRGHAYTPENTARNPNGNRYCRTCANARAMLSHHRQRGGQLADRHAEVLALPRRIRTARGLVAR